MRGLSRRSHGGGCCCPGDDRDSSHCSKLYSLSTPDAQATAIFLPIWLGTRARGTKQDGRGGPDVSPGGILRPGAAVHSAQISGSPPVYHRRLNLWETPESGVTHWLLEAMSQISMYCAENHVGVSESVRWEGGFIHIQRTNGRTNKPCLSLGSDLLCPSIVFAQREWPGILPSRTAG
ncbi:hypothetical protein BO70DRAFT_82825 [Aspergillus heteromorphus CBS 117.55]|uniref:Uncharacterized protein n=1 Tax=Aspergillus heteromorphus CBS 117.55 TaxID=1448321 RepID=A0A317X364_9EURO|nr:uncharacterized protein BO70DRAFT_82825 [Aspergillus heteromorphus CBS 117.55]PWY91000.1 hypothetical protein BO70DRAFT_82825 [Aspergillus heteromorphus CBS 117.55]